MDQTHLSQRLGSESLSAKEKLSSIPERDFGRIAVAAGAASTLLAAKPNSVFGGVQIGTITYSFRSLPSSAEEVLKYCLDCGISAIELMSEVAEASQALRRGPVADPVAGTRTRGSRRRWSGRPSRWSRR